MAEDIALDIYSTSSSASTSTETLFDARKPLLGSKVHKGYGASKIPVRPTAAGGFAGSQYDSIFHGQLGSAAGDPNNPLGEKLDNLFYPNRLSASQHKEFQDILEESGHLLREEIKPAHLNWNKETRKQFPKHWREVSRSRNRQAERLPGVTPLNKELILPFSNNIGPGNPIRPATNTADFIAQGHDIHYKDAKKDSDVLSADREAISQFAHEAVSGQDPVSRIHATIGGVGLGIKHAVESGIGKVLYG